MNKVTESLRYILTVILAMGIILSTISCGKSDKSGAETLADGVYDVVYLGVKDYGEDGTTKENIANFRYRFLADGNEKILSIDNSLMDDSGTPLYPIQNRLKENYKFHITVNDGTVTDTEEIRETEGTFKPVVEGKPGEKTLINFIRTALMPVGTTLYIYGGGWDWQDEGSAIQARTLGVSPDWVKFFNEHDVNYTFRDIDDDESKRDPKTSYFPFGSYNEYYYAGLDCSGFVGWVIYNTFETENGKDGYVCSSTKMAGRLAGYGWGDFSQEMPGIADENDIRLLPGDVVSIKGHVWISLGTCEDGSILIVHSTNGHVSRTGQPGGGVALSAVGRDTNCEAYRLADKYMSKYYPEWYSRYPVSLSDPEKYLKIEGDTAGRFSWNTAGGAGLTDEARVQDMTPAQVISLCFGE